MALKVQSIYALWYLCSDLIYAILFPQLLCVIYVKNVNTYGALLGYIVAVILRVGGGESVINLDPFIKYPYYNESDGQLFPFRTFAMLSSLVVIIFASFLMKVLFESKLVSKRFDIFQCFPESHEANFISDEPQHKDGAKLVGVTKV